MTSTTPPEAPAPSFDLIVRNGDIYDGSGAQPVRADVAVIGDRIRVVGALPDGAHAAVEIDASGLAVAPGFINMLSHSYLAILHDGRSLGELEQGVTTQVFGEGTSMGPLTPQMRDNLQAQDPVLSYEVKWTSLAEYLAYAESHGISQNIASYIGATTLRIYVAGYDEPPPHRRRAGHRARPGPRRDVGRRHRHRLLADLPARVLCGYRGAGRDVPGGGAVRRRATSRICATKARSY